MEQWKKYKLGEVITIKYGKDHKSLGKGTYPVYGSGGIMRYADKYICKEPSILIPRKGSLNNIFFVNTPFWSVDTMFWTIIDQTKVSPIYLYYAICKYNFADLNVGSAVPSLTVPVIEGIEVTLPPLPEQKRIADILKSLDDKIELNRQINDNLEQQAQALYKSWFVDFEPFKEGKFVDSELGLIPEGWRVGTLGDYSKIKSGFAFKSAWWQENGIKVIKIKNIGINNTLDTNDCSYVSEDKMMFAKDFSLQEYDLLIAMTGATIGKFTIVPNVGERLLVNQRVGKFFLGNNPVNKLPFLYLTLMQHNVISDIINRGQGSAQPNISPFDIETVEITIPNSDILDNFNCKMQPIFKSLTHFISENQNLERLRDTLLPKLMSGELKINDLNS